MTAAITDTSAFTPGDFVITKSAAGFTAVNTVTGASTALGAGPNLAFDGMTTVTVTGTAPTNGDSVPAAAHCRRGPEL